MTKIKKISVLVGLISLFLYGTAFATYVDFTALSPPHVNNVLTSPYATPIPGGGSITIAAFSISSSGLNNENLWWDSTDGFGISSSAGYEKDEIELLEIMRISFSSPVNVSYFDLTDLFIEGNDPYAEIGVWYSPGLGLNFFSQYDSTVSNGEFQLDIDQDISEIWFSAPAEYIPGQDHEFSIAGVEVTSVPEPSTLILLGCGLIVFAGLGRNRLKKK